MSLLRGSTAADWECAEDVQTSSRRSAGAGLRPVPRTVLVLVLVPGTGTESLVLYGGQSPTLRHTPPDPSLRRALPRRATPGTIRPRGLRMNRSRVVVGG